MTNEEAKKMLKAKLECLKRETSGTDIDCNSRNCDECSLCYEQGNMGEQKEALGFAIKAVEQTRWISVTEELPKIGKHVLVSINPFIENRHPIIISSREKGKEKYWTDGTILAWMPLPQPYKAESEKKE